MIFDPLHTTVLFCVGIVGGALSAIAGGASFFTFPALIYVGLPPIIANATNFVGLVPGNVTALPAYWAEIKRLAPLLLWPIIITIFGGAGGSIMLLTAEGSTFETLIPWLMAFATLMFAIGPYIHVWVNRRRTTALSIKLHLPLLSYWLCQSTAGISALALESSAWLLCRWLVLMTSTKPMQLRTC